VAAEETAETLVALRDLLQAAGYDPASFREVNRLATYTAPADAAAIVREQGTSEPLLTLLGLLAIGDWVPRAAARRALAPLDVDQLVRAGLVEGDGDRRVRATCRVLPYEGLMLLGDANADEGRDVVQGASRISAITSWLTPRQHRDTMLDLGCGSGVQALLASRHCQRVVGVDLNPRALHFAALAAAMNQADNVEWREGSWFEPAAGQRFDLIVGNPPYLISPDREFTYRDSGEPDLCMRLCRETPNHLEENGVAVLLCMWGHATPDDWQTVPRSWVAGAGCDAIVICFNTSGPVEHAVSWNSPSVRQLEPDRLRDTVARWVRYLDDAGIGAISFGAIVLRRRTNQDNWGAFARATGQTEEGASRQITRMIAGNDLIAAGADLLARSYRIPDGLGVAQRFATDSGAWTRRDSIVTISGELGVSAAVHPDALDVLLRCDGSTSLRELVLDEKQAAVAIDAVRALLAHGLLDG
jgi:methylase of polypeptide subunit release factors